jgi:transcriptional regulator with GAF, ATPase, and Fis domain
MTTAIRESSAPWEQETPGYGPGSAPWKDDETRNVIDDHRRDDSVTSTWPRDESLLKLLYELVVGIPAMADVQALCVWFDQSGERSIRLQLLMDDLPKKLRAGMELPLDNAIARWIWRHQRPLIIAAEEDARFPDFALLLLEWGIKFFCAVPLLLANRRIGVLGLASTSREALRSFDLEFAQRGVANLARATKEEGELPDVAETRGGFRGGTISLEEDVSSKDNFEGIIGRSAAMEAVRKQVKIVAPTGSTVLILGETGTGKELMAQAIHNLLRLAQ